MTVLKNLTMAPVMLKIASKEEAEETAYHYLEVVGLKNKADAYPPMLSGGQRAKSCDCKISLYEIKDHFIRRTYFGTGSGDGSGSLGCHDSIIQTEYYDGGRDT